MKLWAGLAQVCGQRWEEMPHHQRDVFFVLTQRRQIDGDDVKAEEEVLAEKAFFDKLL